MYEQYLNSLGYKVARPGHWPYIVKDFQRHAGLDDDSIIGPKTRAAIAKYNHRNFCPEIYEPIKPYIVYSDDQIESLCTRGLEGLGLSFNRWSRINDFDVIHNIAHAILESGYGESEIAQEKNNIYGWRAYDHDPMNSANSFDNKAECIKAWSDWFNKQYLLPTGDWYAGGASEFCVNQFYASSAIAGINKTFVAKRLRRQLLAPEEMTEAEYETLGRTYHLTKDFVLGEFYSTQVVNGVQISRAVKPPFIYFEEILKTAINAQIIRDRLNDVYGENPAIGIRNSAGEIILIVGSGWRSNAFQYWLWTNLKSTTNDSQHELGKAVDLNIVPGLTMEQFVNLVEVSDTDFTWIKKYAWGLHFDTRTI